MTDTGLSWSPPQATGGMGQRSLVVWATLSVAAYLGSAGLVRLFDYVSARAQLAQLVQRDGPLYRVFLDGPTPTRLGLALTWLTDWRAVVIWALVAAVAVAALAVAGRLRSKGEPGFRAKG